ncbi:MAG: carbon monoxide dehydrogenase subunit G [Ktedonobacteraceae bacterium]
MKLNGSHKFKVSSVQVYNAILNPAVLKECIPGCQTVEYLDPNSIKASITTPLPGLKGPYNVIINIAQRQAPNNLTLQVQRQGTGGSINALSNINILDEPDGALLKYDANADLSGPIAIANNPIGQGFTKGSLGSFFKNLDKAIV